MKLCFTLISLVICVNLSNVPCITLGTLWDELHCGTHCLLRLLMVQSKRWQPLFTPRLCTTNYITWLTYLQACERLLNIIELVVEFHPQYPNKPSSSSCIVTHGTHHSLWGFPLVIELLLKTMVLIIKGRG